MADTVSIAGAWAYQSYLNSAGQPIFGAGTFTFATPTATTLQGTLEFGGGLGLDLQGTIRPATDTCPLAFDIVGTGRAGTGTAGWEYDYNGVLARQWPNGIDQAPSLVGSTIRAKPHDGGAAGLTASFIAVRQA